ncbi:MAG: hypothetical protein ACYS8W_17820, partial [Planctomycetota bacterium]
LKKKNITLFAVTPRSRFLIESRFVKSISDGSAGLEDVGLEDVFAHRITSWTASKDTPYINYFPRRARHTNLIVPYIEIPAAYGWYAVEHLVNVTDGRYVYFEEVTEYDNASTAPYMPDFAAIKDETSKANRSPIVRELRKLVEAWNKSYTPPIYDVLSKEIVLKAKNEALKHREFIDGKTGTLSALRKKLKSSKKLSASEPLRWQADLDLAIAQLRVASFHLGQYVLAAENWTDSENPQSKFPGGLIFKQLLDAPGKTVSEGDLKKLAVELHGGKNELNAYMFALKECNHVIDTHPGTPWAKAAEELRKMWTIRIVGYTPKFGPGGAKREPGKKH